MGVQRRDFLWLAILAASAMAAFGQTGISAVGPKSVASIPDFSGIWSHPYGPASNRRHPALVR